MIGIGECAAGDVPRLVPWYETFVHQQTHQFGYREGRVGVVQLRGEHVREVFYGFPPAVEQAQHVLQRAGHEEILLGQAQSLAGLGLIVGIQHL